MIAAANAYKYISERYLLRKSTKGWWGSDCPMCGKRKKFAFNFNWSRCKCWSCGHEGSIVDLVMVLEDMSYIAARTEIMAADGEGIDLELFEVERSAQVSEVDLPIGYTPLLDGRGNKLGERAIRYLEGRGFDAEELDALGFGYVGTRARSEQEDYFGRIIMPIRQDGKLRYFIGRDYIGGFPKYMNPDSTVCGVGKNQVIYGADAFNACRTVYVSEGIFNAMTMGHEGAATLGWSWGKDQTGWMVASECRTVVILADPGFYARAMKNALNLIEHKRVKVVNFDALGHDEDVNTIGQERTLEMVEATPDLTYEMALEA